MQDDFLKFIRNRGRITEDQYEALRALRRTFGFFGVTAIRSDYVRPDQVAQALDEQIRTEYRERIGSIMLRLKFMTEEQVRDVLDRQKNESDDIGHLLTEMHLLTTTEYQEELTAYNDFHPE